MCFGLFVYNFDLKKVLIFCYSGSTIRKLLPYVEKQNCFLHPPKNSLAVGNEDMVGLFEWALMELEAEIKKLRKKIISNIKSLYVVCLQK